MAEFEFRDGKREIPDYLADVLIEYQDKLYQITYEQAMELANRLMLEGAINRRADAVIADHFRRLRSG